MQNARIQLSNAIQLIELNNCGFVPLTGGYVMAINTPKCFPLPTSITSVLFRFNFNQLILPKCWTILVTAEQLYVLSGRESCVICLLLAFESTSSDWQLGDYMYMLKSPPGHGCCWSANNFEIRAHYSSKLCCKLKDSFFWTKKVSELWSGLDGSAGSSARMVSELSCAVTIQHVLDLISGFGSQTHFRWKWFWM